MKTLHELADQAGFDIIDGVICAPSPDGACEDEINDLILLLQPEKQKPALNTVQPIHRYMSLYAEAEELLTRLHVHDDHYGENPDTVTWGHVGSLAHFVEILQYAAHALPGQKT